MATDVQIYNMALARLGAKNVTAIADHRRINAQALYDQTRDEIMEAYPWYFTPKRIRISAAGILDCSAKTITFADADPDTITDSGTGFVTAGFLTGDRVGVSGSGSNETSYDITTAVAAKLTLDTHEEVVAEVLTNDTDLKLYAKPGHLWGYKYAIPSGATRILAVEENYEEATGNPTWAIEQGYIVTNELDDNDQIHVTYIENITTSTLWTKGFISAFILSLASKLAVPLVQDQKLKNDLAIEYDGKIKDVLATNATTENPDTTRTDTSWQKR